MLKTAMIAAVAFAASAGLADAGTFDSSSSYNAPVGMASTSQNTPVTSSLRDANGNLEVVDGKITSSSFNEVGGVQSFNPGQTGIGAGVNGSATAIGNQLNVVTAGSNNIVIVDSTQTNNGDQNANNNVH